MHAYGEWEHTGHDSIFINHVFGNHSKLLFKSFTHELSYIWLVTLFKALDPRFDPRSNPRSNQRLGFDPTSIIHIFDPSSKP